MTTYVLEILDGDHKGTVLILEGARATIGRKPSNHLAIADEKCSGEHAEVVLEDGRWVLRDLGSRNGTTLDGRRIDEVVLSPFDVFQVGRVQIVFRDREQAMATDDMQLETLDRAAMSRRGGRRRSSAGLIAVLALLGLAGGAWAWLQYGGGGADGGGGGARGPRAPLVVAGNLLGATTANFEESGGWVLDGLETGGFEQVIGRALAHTGEGAIEASQSIDGDVPAGSGGGAGPRGARLALARTAETVSVIADSTLRLAGHLLCDGGATAAMRVVFHSSVDGSRLIAGTAPAPHDDYELVELRVAVPRGMDRAEVQVLALLPTAESMVRADDVSLAVDHTDKLTPISLSTDNGRNLTAVGGSFRVTTGDRAVLLGVRPTVGDGAPLHALGRSGELAPSDVGLTLQAQLVDDHSFALRFVGADGGGGQATGLVLEFPLDSASVLTRASADAPFVPRDATFDRTSVREVVLGAEATRCALRFDATATVSARIERDVYAITLHDTLEFALQVRFTDSAKAAGELNREAAAALRNGSFAAALDAVQKVAEIYPHDDRVLRDAQAMRVQLLGSLSQQVAELQREGASARFFDARNGYARVAGGVESLIQKYGEAHVPQLEALQALADRMREGIAVIDRAAGRDHRQSLVDLAEVLVMSGGEDLATVVRAYTSREYPANGEGGDTEGNK